MKNFASRFFTTVLTGWAACSLHAQGTISAVGTLTETGQSGGTYDYALVLENTGSVPINAFWYGWIQNVFDLPGIIDSSPIGGPVGWIAGVDFNSVQFQNASGSAIAVGSSGTFTFSCAFNPTQMTTGSISGVPVGDSVVYATGASMNGSQENIAGVASGPFQVLATPEPATAGLCLTGLAGMSLWLARRRSESRPQTGAFGSR